MNHFHFLVSGENDVTAVGAMAQHSFDGAVVAHPLVQRGLPEMVRVMVQLLHGTQVHMSRVHKWVKKQFGMKYTDKYDPLKLFVECSWLLLAYRHKVHEAEMASDTEAFLLRYPHFSWVDGEELAKLVPFRNCMVIALNYIRARMNLEYLLQLCTRLTEGCKAKYTKGSGATAETTRREEIYRIEGEVPLEPRRPRRERESLRPLDLGLDLPRATELSLPRPNTLSRPWVDFPPVTELSLLNPPASPSPRKRSRSEVDSDTSDEVKRTRTDSMASSDWRPQANGMDLLPTDFEEFFPFTDFGSSNEEENDMEGLDSLMQTYLEDPDSFAFVK